MTEQLVDILRRGRERIATPDKWTKGAAARTSTGRRCMETSPRAVCWCMIGAINAELGGLGWRAVEPAREALGVGYVPRFNDNPATTHADVLAAFDRAIAKLEGQPVLVTDPEAF